MKSFACQFVGSFYRYDQLPKDRKPQIAFAGRSNVGKSSLLNKITGQRKLAKVSGTPGKTRSINMFLINDEFYFVDLPGYGYARVSKTERESWGKMIATYLDKSPSLAGLVLLIDCRREVTPEDADLIAWMTERGLPCLPVLTKADKLTRDKLNRSVKKLGTDFGLTGIPFSTVSGIGKKEVLGAVLDLVSQRKVNL